MIGRRSASVLTRSIDSLPDPMTEHGGALITVLALGRHFHDMQFHGESPPFHFAFGRLAAITNSKLKHTSCKDHRQRALRAASPTGC